MNLQNWLKNATQKLSTITETSRLEAELLLLHVLKSNKTLIYTDPEKTISDQNLFILQNLLTQRLSGIPLAYILGEKEFWSMPFKVTPDVLIPRPETEHLVEIALELLDTPRLLLDTHRSTTVLELGTGSGAIAIALAKERPHWKIMACDNSPGALSVAKENAHNLLSPQSIEFLLSNWFENIPSKKFSAIISNPPYISTLDTHLNNLQHEPISALSSGLDGLDDIRHIIQESRAYLESEGILLLEHGYNQGETVRELLNTHGFIQIKTYEDLAGLERVTLGQYL